VRACRAARAAACRLMADRMPCSDGLLSPPPQALAPPLVRARVCVGLGVSCGSPSDEPCAASVWPVPSLPSPPASGWHASHKCSVQADEVWQMVVAQPVNASRQGMGCTKGRIRATVGCCLPLQLLQRRGHQPQVLLSLVGQLPGNVGLLGGCFEPPTPPESGNKLPTAGKLAQPFLLGYDVSTIFIVLTSMVRTEGRTSALP
jgi:hypothetical protein